MGSSIDLLILGGHEQRRYPNQLQFGLLQLDTLNRHVDQEYGEEESLRLQLELHMHINHPVEEDGPHALSHLGLEGEGVEGSQIRETLEVLQYLERVLPNYLWVVGGNDRALPKEWGALIDWTDVAGSLREYYIGYVCRVINKTKGSLTTRIPKRE